MNTEKKTSIIAALDISEGMQKVAERACLLASSMNLPVRLIHIVDDTAVVNYANESGLGELVTGEFEERLDAAGVFARNYIESRIADIIRECGELEIIDGQPARTLEEIARESNAAMIVVGQPETHFGSVVKHVAYHAPCDVHIVRVDDDKK